LNKNEKKLLFWWIVMLIMILGVITTVSGCNSGWSVGNLEVSPSESVHIDYLVITDQDSTQHLYRPSIGEGMIVGDNYCYKHNIWEDVRKTSE
tara:strand:+ start:1610 stop:1888 length:279 start_codon:yes stop_codon:yes gene_type:complete